MKSDISDISDTELMKSDIPDISDTKLMESDISVSSCRSVCQLGCCVGTSVSFRRPVPKVSELSI